MRINFRELVGEKAELGLGFAGFMRFIEEEDRAEIAIFALSKQEGFGEFWER